MKENKQFQLSPTDNSSTHLIPTNPKLTKLNSSQPNSIQWLSQTHLSNLALFMCKNKEENAEGEEVLHQ